MRARLRSAWRPMTPLQVRAENEQVQRQMEDLRAANKVKTATYRQLFATRITLKEIVSRLEEHGL